MRGVVPSLVKDLARSGSAPQITPAFCAHKFITRPPPGAGRRPPVLAWSGSTLSGVDRGRMRRLVKANFPVAGQLDRRFDSPVFLFDRRAVHAFSLQRCHERRQVVAHQVEDRAQKLPSAVELTSVAVGRVNPSFCRRQGKNEPTTASIYGAEAKSVTKECSICLRVVAVEENVSADNAGGHGPILSKRHCRWLPCCTRSKLRRPRSAREKEPALAVRGRRQGGRPTRAAHRVRTVKLLTGATIFGYLVIDELLDPSPPSPSWVPRVGGGVLR